MTQMRILLVDDDKRLAEVLSLSLRKQGGEVVACHNVDDALAALQASMFDVVVTDLRMPGRGGLELVREVCSAPAPPPVVVLTAHGSLDAAVEAMRAGAVDFLAKPVSRDVLKMTLERVVRGAAIEKENVSLKQRLEQLEQPSLIAAAPAMQHVLALVDRVATSDATVLLRGESGTGKELLARRLHDQSPRRQKAFVPLNCAALPKDLLESELFGHAKGAFTGAHAARKGRFVEAHEGTLFLDEIGDLDLDLQGKLLRVLQDGVVDVVGGGTEHVDVRIVAATHQDLDAMVADGRFREDLFFRVRVVPVDVPPLRDRPEDIPALFASFVARAAAKAGTTPPDVDTELQQALQQRPWPGNVRELENVAIRLTVSTAPGASLSADALFADDGAWRQASSRGDSVVDGDHVTLPEAGVSLEAVERALICAALSAAGGNQTQAAKLLRVPRHVLLYRVDKYGIVEGDVAALKGKRSAPVVATASTTDV